MNANFDSILASIRFLFDIDAEATVAEIDQHLIDQVEAAEQNPEQSTATAEELAEAATPQQAEEAPTEAPAPVAEEAPAAEQDAEEDPGEDDPLQSLQALVDKQQATIQQQQKLIEQLQHEIEVIKLMDAAPPTGGKLQAPKQAGSWMNHPMNQKLRRQDN